MIRSIVLLTACLLTLSAFAGGTSPTWGEFLRGQWVTECKQVNFGVYAQAGYTFSDFTGVEFQIVAQTNAQYFDSKCSKPIYFSQTLGHLKLASLNGTEGEQPFAEPVVKGAHIRWGMTPIIQYPIAFYDKKLVAEQNRKIYCGKADWEAGKAKDLLQTNCAKDINNYYANNWFFLVITDASHMRLSDKSGEHDDIERTMFDPGTKFSF